MVVMKVELCLFVWGRQWAMFCFQWRRWLDRGFVGRRRCGLVRGELKVDAVMFVDV